MAEPLSAPYVLTYAYKRSTGPVIGGFLTALRDAKLVGVRGADGRVLCPPVEYDPRTGDTLSELVPVGPGGVVTTWCWVSEPRPTHPLDRPFAFALVKLDGADTPLLHAVDAGDEVRMATGMRVRARFRDERVGYVTDLVFEPEEGEARPVAPVEASEPVWRVKTPVKLDYTVYPGTHYAKFLGGMAEGRVLGAPCGECGKVYVPPRGSCPTCGVPSGEPQEVSDVGTLCSFCIIRIPFEGQRLTPPYVFGSILLDGADLPIFHLVSGCALEDIHMGMRLRARWKPKEEWGPTLESIHFFEPSGEPDADFASYQEHL